MNSIDLSKTGYYGVRASELTSADGIVDLKSIHFENGVSGAFSLITEVYGFVSIVRKFFVSSLPFLKNLKNYYFI